MPDSHAVHSDADHAARRNLNTSIMLTRGAGVPTRDNTHANRRQSCEPHAFLAICATLRRMVLSGDDEVARPWSGHLPGRALSAHGKGAGQQAHRMGLHGTRRGCRRWLIGSNSFRARAGPVTPPSSRAGAPFAMGVSLGLKQRARKLGYSGISRPLRKVTFRCHETTFRCYETSFQEDDY